MNSTVYDVLLKNMSPELMANLIKCPPNDYRKVKCSARGSCAECVTSFIEQNISDDDAAALIESVKNNHLYISIPFYNS